MANSHNDKTDRNPEAQESVDQTDSSVAGISPLLTALKAKASGERRSAAKRLRKLKNPAAGPDLLDALRIEVRDPRTWETQYHMVMALGESGYKPALPDLKTLAQQGFDATMVYVALGDAIVRLGRDQEDDPSPVLWAMGTGNPMLMDGAFRAVATLRLKLTPSAIQTILDHVTRLSPNDGLRFWVAVAAAGWSGPQVERFLEQCAANPRDDVREAASDARRGHYRNWKPL